MFIRELRKTFRFLSVYLFTLNFIIYTVPVSAASRATNPPRNKALAGNLGIKKKKLTFNQKLNAASTYGQYAELRDLFRANGLKSNKLNCQSYFSLPSDKQCNGTFTANNQTELNLYYSSNYGLANNKYKDLKINFNPGSGEILLKTPCKLTIVKDLSADELCAVGRKGVESSNGRSHNFSGNITINSEVGDVSLGNNNQLQGNFLFLQGGVNTNVGNNSTISANGMLVFADTNNISIQNNVHLNGGNSFMEAQNSVLIGANSEINFQGNYVMVADSPSKNSSIGNNAVINVGSFFLASFGGGGETSIGQNSQVTTTQASLKMISNGAGLVNIKQNNTVNAKGIDLSTAGVISIDQNSHLTITEQPALFKSTGVSGNHKVQFKQNMTLTSEQEIDVSANLLVQIDQNVSISTQANINLDGSQCNISQDLELSATSESGRCAQPLITTHSTTITPNEVVYMKAYSVDLDQDQYNASLGNSGVTLYKSHSDRLFFFVPNVSSGSKTLTFTIGGKQFAIPLTLVSSGSVGDVDAVLNEARQKVVSLINQVPPEYSTEITNLNNLLAQYDVDLSQLSGPDKYELAELIIANQGVFNQNNKVNPKAMPYLLDIQPDLNNQNVALLKANITSALFTLSTLGTAFYIISKGPTIFTISTIKLATLFILAGVGIALYTLKRANFSFENIFTNSPDEGDINQQKGPFDFIVGAPKNFLATAPFRKIDQRDLSSTEGPILNTIKIMIDFYELWNDTPLEQFTGAEPIDPRTRDTAILPDQTFILNPQFITLGEISTPSISGNLFSVGNSLNLLFNTSEATTQNFNFKIIYHPSFYAEKEIEIQGATLAPPPMGCIGLFPPNGVVGYYQENGGGFVAQTAAVHPSVYIETGSEVCENASIFPLDVSTISITGNSIIRGSTNMFSQNSGQILVNNAKFGLNSNDTPTSGTDGAQHPSGLEIDGATIYESAGITGSSHVTGVDTKVYGHALIANNATISGGAKVSGSSLVFENANVHDFAEVSIDGSFPPNFYQISGNAEIANLGTLVEGGTTVSQNAKVLNGAIISGSNNSIRGTCIVDFGQWSGGGLNVPDQQNNSCAPFSGKYRKNDKDMEETVNEIKQRKAYYDEMAANFRRQMHSKNRYK